MAILLDILADWTPVDLNGDGWVTGDDIGQAGFDPGSANAKIAWEKIYKMAHSQTMVKKAMAQGHLDATGMYHGKAIVAHPSGGMAPDAGSYELLRDRLIYYKGMEPAVADRIVNTIVQHSQTDLINKGIPTK